MDDNSSMISIDFWDTLVEAKVGGKKRREIRHKALYKVSDDYGKSFSLSEINAVSKMASEEFNRIWFSQHRTPTVKEIISKILNNLGIPATKLELDFLIDQFEKSLLEGPPAVLDGAKETIHSLSTKYQLTLISDTMYSPGKVIRRFLQEEDLLNYFDAFLFSDEAGFSKPNPKAFHNMLKDTGCEASQSYHIGDRINTDIAGAKGVGMKAILFTGISKKDLKSNSRKEVHPDYSCENWNQVSELLL